MLKSLVCMQKYFLHRGIHEKAFFNFSIQPKREGIGEVALQVEAIKTQ